MDIIDKFEKVYTQIEQTKGPGVVVTIGSGAKIFGAGFNLPFWGSEVKNPIVSLSKYQATLNQVMTLGMPTMAVFNGHSIAGGLIHGLAHDFRIMTSDPKKRVQLSEINLGFAMPRGHNALCASMLTKKAFRELALGIAWSPQQALKEDVVDSLFSTPEECEQQIKAFAKKFARVGA